MCSQLGAQSQPLNRRQLAVSAAGDRVAGEQARERGECETRHAASMGGRIGPVKRRRYRTGTLKDLSQKTCDEIIGSRCAWIAGSLDSLAKVCAC